MKPLPTATLLAILLLSLSCEKDQTPIAAWDYMPLEPGAMWTYATVLVDTAGTEELLSTDTLWLRTMEIVGQHRLASFEGTKNFLFESMVPAFDLRDSSGLLVNSSGQLMLSLDPSDHERLVEARDFGSDLGSLVVRLNTQPTQVDVPYGSFESIGTTLTVELTDTTHPNHQRMMHRYYGKGVGLVKATAFFLSSPHLIETRLTGFFFEQ